jgi:hypothetical protein
MVDGPQPFHGPNQLSIYLIERVGPALDFRVLNKVFLQRIRFSIGLIDRIYNHQNHQVLFLGLAQRYHEGNCCQRVLAILGIPFELSR